jgi:putative acetyltransferase
MTSVHIRPFQASDSKSLAQIYHQAVHKTGLEAYSQEQVKVWSQAPVSAEEFLKRVSDGRFIWVALNNVDQPIGFIELEKDGHIDCFYCHPNETRNGVGTALYSHLEIEATALNITRLFVEASEIARPFFLSNGYQLIKRRDFLLRGISIHNYLMEKNLSTSQLTL